jgi:hypothetical protein
MILYVQVLIQNNIIWIIKIEYGGNPNLLKYGQVIGGPVWVYRLEGS